MVSLFLLLGCNLSYIVDLFAALHELASANARTLLKLASSVRALLKPYGDTLIKWNILVTYYCFNGNYISYLVLLPIGSICDPDVEVFHWLSSLYCRYAVIPPKACIQQRPNWWIMGVHVWSKLWRHWFFSKLFHFMIPTIWSRKHFHFYRQDKNFHWTLLLIGFTR